MVMEMSIGIQDGDRGLSMVFINQDCGSGIRDPGSGLGMWIGDGRLEFEI